MHSLCALCVNGCECERVCECMYVCVPHTPSQVVTEGTAVVERPLAVDTGRDPQRSLEQARLCASQIEESAQLGTREEVITHANNVMSLLDLCRGLGAACRQPQQRDRMVQAGKVRRSSRPVLRVRRVVLCCAVFCCVVLCCAVSCCRVYCAVCSVRLYSVMLCLNLASSHSASARARSTC